MPIEIKNGIIHPDKESVNQLLLQIETETAKNPKMKELLNKDPAQFLSSIGLNEDVRRELLADSGIPEPACVFTCLHTCWFTQNFCKITIQYVKKK